MINRWRIHAYCCETNIFFNKKNMGSINFTPYTSPSPALPYIHLTLFLCWYKSNDSKHNPDSATSNHTSIRSTVQPVAQKRPEYYLLCVSHYYLDISAWCAEGRAIEYPSTIHLQHLHHDNEKCPISFNKNGSGV
jgi:hypothetical protein